MLPAVFGRDLWAYFKSIYHDVGGVFMYRAVVSLWFTPLESEYRTLSHWVQTAMGPQIW